jgi:hypothetical protein
MGSIFTGFFFLDSLTLEEKYYHFVLHNIQEGRRPYLLGGGSLKSRNFQKILVSLFTVINQFISIVTSCKNYSLFLHYNRQYEASQTKKVQDNSKVNLLHEPSCLPVTNYYLSLYITI